MTIASPGLRDSLAKGCVVTFSAGFLAWYVAAKFAALMLS